MGALLATAPAIMPITATAAENNVKGTEPLRISHGAEVKIQDFLVPGKYTVFDFYSDFCPPCRTLKPKLEQLHATRQDVALVVVDINRPGVKGIDWKSPVALQYELHSIPHLTVFGPDGKLVAEDNAKSPEARKLVQTWMHD
jgi:thiol-disulfide isomerase/thioredoxin